MNHLDQEHIRFEDWYTKEFFWYIERNRRGYNLNKKPTGEYVWEHPSMMWLAWMGCVNHMKGD